MNGQVMAVAPARTPAQSPPAQTSGVRQGKCDPCRKKKPVLQRAAIGPVPETVPPIVHEVLRSPGQPLDRETREFMEARFGYDFSNVRIHTDGKAIESARTLGAFAYSANQQIVFGKDRFTPSTFSGKQLLAHELAHVAQMESSREGPSRIAGPGDLWENDASRAASAISNGRSYRVTGDAPPYIYMVADPRLRTFLARLRELSSEMRSPLRTEYIVDRIFETLDGLELSNPDNLTPVVQTVSESFRSDVLLAFLENVEQNQPQRREPTPSEAAQMERTIGMMQVGRRGPYAQYGPGVVIPVMSQAARPLYHGGRSISAFFEGLLEGLRGNISDTDIQALRQRITSSIIVNVVLPVVIVSGTAVGIVQDIYNAIRGVIEIIGNIREVATQMLTMLNLMVSEEGAEVARALGSETGRNYANRIRELTRHGVIRFTYEVGRLVGPMVVYTILSLATAGAVAGAAVSARVASVLSRFPRIARFLENVGSRLRRIRRRGRPDSPDEPPPTGAHVVGASAASRFLSQMRINGRPLSQAEIQRATRIFELIEREVADAGGDASGLRGFYIPAGASDMVEVPSIGILGGRIFEISGPAFPDVSRGFVFVSRDVVRGMVMRGQLQTLRVIVRHEVGEVLEMGPGALWPQYGPIHVSHWRSSARGALMPGTTRAEQISLLRDARAMPQTVGGPIPDAVGRALARRLGIEAAVYR